MNSNNTRMVIIALAAVILVAFIIMQFGREPIGTPEKVNETTTEQPAN
ncbi:MAG: hypothetical protein ACR2O4_14470 [Hyphomicrobiaceae bacterium]